jgi:hypothetical protein
MQKYKEITAYSTESKYNKSYDKRMKEYDDQRKKLEKESTSFWNPFSEDDAEREYEAIGRKKDLLVEEKKAYEEFLYIQEQINNGDKFGYDKNGNFIGDLEEERKKLAEEYGFFTDKEIENAKKMQEILGQMSENSANFFSKNGLFDENSEELLQQMEKNGGLNSIIGAFKVNEEEGAKEMTDQLMRIIETTDDEKLKKVAQEKLDNVFKNVQVKGITK